MLFSDQPKSHASENVDGAPAPWISSLRNPQPRTARSRQRVPLQLAREDVAADAARSRLDCVSKKPLIAHVANGVNPVSQCAQCARLQPSERKPCSNGRDAPLGIPGSKVHSQSFGRMQELRHSMPLCQEQQIEGDDQRRGNHLAPARHLHVSIIVWSLAATRTIGFARAVVCNVQSST